MGKIYQNSNLMLAAVKAHNRREGLLTERFEQSLTPCQMVDTYNDWRSLDVVLSNEGPSPLYKRGWEVHERCLSR